MKIIVVLLAFLAIPATYGQKLKLHLEPGISIPLTTYNLGPFWHPFTTKPIPNEYYTFEKTWKSPFFFQMHSRYWLLLGYETRKGMQFELGYNPMEGLQYFLNWRWHNYDAPDSLTGTTFMLSNGYFTGFDIPGHKVRGSVSIPVNKDRKNGLVVYGILGASWLYFGKEVREPVTSEGYFPETIYQDTSIILGLGHWNQKPNTVLLLGGVQLSYFTKKREWISLKLIYEQGLFIVGQVDYHLIRDKKIFSGSVASRGSAIHLKLSVPIDLYRFKKERGKSE